VAILSKTMRKQSLAVPLTIVLGVAAAACDENAQCTDANGVVVDDSNCASVADDAGAPTPGRSGFFWYYGGRSFSPGARVSGGSYYRSPTKSYSSPSGYSWGGGSSSSPGIGRGGFGGHGDSVGG
jgi:hypothetical protein